jgi:hypothetical protein
VRRFFLFVLICGLLATACGDDRGGKTTERRSPFCTKAASLDGRFDDLQTGPAFTKAAAALDKLRTTAPKEIEADVATVARDMRTIGGALGDLDLSDQAAMSNPANAARLRTFREQIAAINKEVQVASDRIARFLHARCGLDLGGLTTTTTTAG